MTSEPGSGPEGAFAGTKYFWLERLYRLELSGRELRILGVIASAHRDGCARLLIRNLVDRTGLPRRTVQRTVDAIERKGLVAIERSKGGPAPHIFTLLDPGGTLPDVARTERENCATLSGAVGKGENCATLDGAVTAPLHARARKNTLSVVPRGPATRVPLGEVADATEVDISSSSFAPDGAQEDETDDCPFGSSAEIERRQEDILAGRVTFPERSFRDPARVVDEVEVALAMLSSIVTAAIGTPNPSGTISTRVDALLMDAHRAGNDRALDLERWCIERAQAELARRLAARIDETGSRAQHSRSLASNNKRLAGNG